jgi:hypothetical protein
VLDSAVGSFGGEHGVGATLTVPRQPHEGGDDRPPHRGLCHRRLMRAYNDLPLIRAMAMATYLLLIAYIAAACAVVFGTPHLLVEREWHPLLWALLTYAWQTAADRVTRRGLPWRR